MQENENRLKPKYDYRVQSVHQAVDAPRGSGKTNIAVELSGAER
jgi:hypothetical protein